MPTEGTASSLPRFQMRQCVQETCRFRFPVSAGSSEGQVCPACGASTLFVSTSFAGREPKAAHAAGPTVEALLDNIRSVFNVGAMFRTADGAGIGCLHLCGITATPQHPKVTKTALGAEQAVSWQKYNNGVDAAHAMKEAGYQLWALESTGESESLFAANPRGTEAPLLLIVGNELAGVDPDILALCHRTLYIPMEGVKASLNVAIAFGIAAYYLRYGGS